MNSTRTKKEFDCLKFKQQAQEKIYVVISYRLQVFREKREYRVGKR